MRYLPFKQQYGLGSYFLNNANRAVMKFRLLCDKDLVFDRYVQGTVIDKDMDDDVMSKQA